MQQLFHRVLNLLFGVLNVYFLFQGNRQLFIAAERRIPRIRIETRQAENLMGKRIIVSIDAWPRSSRFPLVSKVV